jgi:hypothetical protein
VVLLVLGFVADRVTVRVVSDQIATQTQRSQNLPTKPSVSIGGALFLPQVVRGDYQDVNIDVRGSTEDGLRVDRVRAHLDGVHVPLSSIIGGNVKKIPVDSLDADVELTYPNINAYLATQEQPNALVTGIHIGPAGSAVKITSTLNFGGQSYPFDGTADIGVKPAAFTYTPRELSQGIAALLPPALRDQVIKLLTITVPVEGLPFNLKLTAATVLPDRMRFSAAGKNVILDTTTIAPTSTTAPAAVG